MNDLKNRTQHECGTLELQFIDMGIAFNRQIGYCYSPYYQGYKLRVKYILSQADILLYKLTLEKDMQLENIGIIIVPKFKLKKFTNNT